jgi:L-seryl-tRNA(Ser) seleniumtransferase
MSVVRSDPRRQLPSVDALLQESPLEELAALYGRESVKMRVRDELARLRSRLAAGEAAIERPAAAIVAAVRDGLERDLGESLRRVLNATGIFVHTNLGRSPLPRPVVDELPSLLDAYCDLEMDLSRGRRGDRNRRVERLLVALTGAEAALVVNNNAAALVLVLACLARDRQVVISRGELVEIGGSFRVPDILAAAGTRLLEVGTTNRTRIEDYEAALGAETGLLLKVHPSNYRIRGFVEEVDAARLAELGRRHRVPVLVDEGSGLLRPSPRPQLTDHVSLSELVAAGCDLACGSGDKLLGGPQAGLLVGGAELIDRCRRYPLYRALRPGRTELALLEAVLRRHLGRRAMPLERLWSPAAEQEARLRRVAAELGAELVAAEAFVGGGAAPDRPVAGRALSLDGGERLFERLRRGVPAVVGYVRDDRVILDLRTVDPAHDDELVAAVRAATAQAAD